MLLAAVQINNPLACHQAQDHDRHHCMMIHDAQACALCPLHWRQVLQSYVEGEKAAAAAEVTNGPLAAAQEQVAALQVRPFAM